MGATAGSVQGAAGCAGTTRELDSVTGQGGEERERKGPLTLEDALGTTETGGESNMRPVVTTGYD